MTNETFYDTLGDIKDDYINEAMKPHHAKKIFPYKIFGAAAACLCLVLVGTTVLFHRTSTKPHPELVQTPNPLLEVQSAKEMSDYLDFDVPVLEKEADTYIVLVVDNYPTMGRIEYQDGSTFSMEYGSGDISGIYGGIFDNEQTINDVRVSFYHYLTDENETMRYALWEKNGFTYSLTGTENLETEIQTLIN